MAVIERNFDVTSSNLQAIMVVDGLFPVGFKLEQFSVDNAISGESVEQTEVRRGIDGSMVVGVIKNPTPVTITLEAGSPTYKMFKLIRDTQQVSNKPFACELTVITPATGDVTVFHKGALTSAPSMSTVGRTLQPTQWVFTFEQVA